jgi:hypothetical protein
MTIWRLIHAVALVLGISLLVALLGPIIAHGNYVSTAHSAEPMNARDTLSFILCFGAMAASAARALFRELDQ